MKNGWHNIFGYKVYVENDVVLRGVIGNNLIQHTVYPYRWNRKLNCWNQETMTVDCFRAGLKRGTVGMK